MTNKQQEMIEYMIQDIVAYLVEDENLDVKSAMDIFYTSATFEKLTDIETGLYLQGSAYVYELLRQELMPEVVNK